jgi:hypothetical protein
VNSEDSHGIYHHKVGRRNRFIAASVTIQIVLFRREEVPSSDSLLPPGQLEDTCVKTRYAK